MRAASCRCRGADEQAPAWDAPAEPLELLRIAQEVDDFLEVGFRFIDAGHILERDPAVALCEQLRPRLAKSHRAPRPRLHLAHEKHPHADQQQHGEPVDERRHDRGEFFVDRLVFELHVLLAQTINQLGIVVLERRKCRVVLQRAVDTIAGNDDLRNVAVGDIIEELRIPHHRALCRAV